MLGTSWFLCHCKWWCSKTVLLLPLNLYFFLPSCLPSFSSFFFGDVELKWGDRHPCRPPSLREKMFSLSPLSMLLTLGFSQITGWRKFPFIPSLFRVFIISGCCILSNTFPCMHWDYLEVMCILLIWWSILWSLAILRFPAGNPLNHDALSPLCINVLDWLTFAKDFLPLCSQYIFVNGCLFSCNVIFWIWYLDNTYIIKLRSIHFCIFSKVDRKALGRIQQSKTIWVWNFLYREI